MFLVCATVLASQRGIFNKLEIWFNILYLYRFFIVSEILQMPQTHSPTLYSRHVVLIPCECNITLYWRNFQISTYTKEWNGNSNRFMHTDNFAMPVLDEKIFKTLSKLRESSPQKIMLTSFCGGNCFNWSYPEKVQLIN